MSNKNKERYVIIIGALLSLVFGLLFSPAFVPTANAINVEGEFYKNPNLNQSPFDKLEGNLDGKISTDKNSETKSDSNVKLEPEVEQPQKIDNSNEKIPSINMDNYEKSLKKIKENYFEIESEIIKLEEIKRQIELANLKTDETKESIKFLQEEINRLKNEKKEEKIIVQEKKPISFYTFLTTINLLALSLLFIFTKNYKRKVKKNFN